MTMMGSLHAGTAPMQECVNHRGRVQDGGEDEKEGKDGLYTYMIMIVMALLSSSDPYRRFGHGVDRIEA
jgi:hypothetical protein